MTTQQAVELLLQRMNNLRNVSGGLFSVMGGTVGGINVLQKDMNKALTTWRETGDSAGLRQMAATLQTLGNLTDAEYEQIMKAIDGDN